MRTWIWWPIKVTVYLVNKYYDLLTTRQQQVTWPAWSMKMNPALWAFLDLKMALFAFIKTCNQRFWPHWCGHIKTCLFVQVPVQHSHLSVSHSEVSFESGNTGLKVKISVKVWPRERCGARHKSIKHSSSYRLSPSSLRPPDTASSSSLIFLCEAAPSLHPKHITVSSSI